MGYHKLFPWIGREPKIDLPREHRLPDGARIYAIGDVHGRLDCLNALLAKIDADNAERGATETTLVFLGDLIDRGPDSRRVIERAIEMSQTRPSVFVMGNHEEILIRAWEGDERAAALFQRVGGRETLKSYGVSERAYELCSTIALPSLIQANVPVGHISFLRQFLDSYSLGDYLFVHAGVKPGVDLSAQSPSDLRWIRNEFLDDGRDHGPLIVHGHSITADTDTQHNRIGIDTGAFASGKLTAIGIEGSERWFLNS